MLKTLISFTLISLLQRGAPLPPVRIILVGDSTVAPKNGWGPGFCADVVPQVTCVNMAKNGRSTSSYREEGFWKEVTAALAHNSEFSATWVFIQFGHNDQPGKPGRSTDLATEFSSNLRQYAREVRAAGAQPVLITSLTRRTFKGGKLDNDLEPWALATKKVAGEEKIPLLDLNTDSAAAIQKMGPVKANTLAMEPPPQAVIDAALKGNSVAVPDKSATTFDYTHLGDKGSIFFGRMVADEVSKEVSTLRRYIKP